MAKLSWRRVGLIAAAGLGVYLFSLVGFLVSAFVPIFFWLLATVFFVLTCRRTEYGLVIIFAELILGAQGYLVSWRGLSLRIMFFLIFMVVALARLYIERADLQEKLREDSHLLGVWGIFLVWLGWSFLNGWLHNEAGAVFFDANAYFFLALFPLCWYFWRTNRWPSALLNDVVAGTLAALGMFTFGMYLLFTHDLWAPVSLTIFRWLRDTKLAEPTNLGSTWRFFMQSQVFVLFGFFVVSQAWVKKELSWVTSFLALSGLFFLLIVAFSRSFLVGLGSGLVVFLLVSLRTAGWRRVLQYSLLGAAALVLALGLSRALAQHPLNNGTVARLEVTGDASWITRKNELWPLWQKIKEHPFIGSGFGTALAYESADPRHVGQYTTFAFEWGYLDMVSKFGIVGLLLYGWWLILSVKLNKEADWKHLAPLAALLTLNLVTPYLNHPLGLGYIYLATFWRYE